MIFINFPLLSSCSICVCWEIQKIEKCHLSLSTQHPLFLLRTSWSIPFSLICSFSFSLTWTSYRYNSSLLRKVCRICDRPGFSSHPTFPFFVKLSISRTCHKWSIYLSLSLSVCVRACVKLCIASMNPIKMQ